MFQPAHSIMTPEGQFPVSSLTRNRPVLTLQHEGFASDEVHSHGLIDFGKELIECAWEGDTEPSFLHPSSRLVSCWSHEPGQFVVALVQCESDGYALTMLEGLPRSIGESPLHYGRTLYRSWNWQKLWFLRGYPRRESAWYELNRLSLEHSLPVLDLKQFAEMDDGLGLFRKLMQEAKTSSIAMELESRFSIGNSPDFLAITQLTQADPVCGFIINQYPDRNGKLGSRLFLVPANCQLGSAVVTSVHRDLVMVKEHFTSQTEATQWLQRTIPDRDTIILGRTYVFQTGCRLLSAARLTPGMMNLGVDRRGNPAFRRLVHVRETEQKGAGSFIDLRLRHSGLVVVNGMVYALEGGAR